MAEKSEDSLGTGDSFEALLRRAARVSQVGPRAVFAAGKKLSGGRFEILRQIGEGGMGVVYEAFDAGRRANVALKTLSRLEAGHVYRLKNEFRALADVSHPNLVRLHELFADEGQWFFTMDLVNGAPFDTWVRPGGSLYEARLRSALPELVSAVSAIHGAGKLHRDLKPSNVLVTQEGRVVVLDFGLAVDPELGGIGQTVADDSVSGTPAYMAPEQAAGKAATAASDFYAIGVMLFEALTGKLPFEGRAAEMLVDKQRSVAPVAVQWCPEAPQDLSALCEELLRRDPLARPDAAALQARVGGVRAANVPPARASAIPDRELLLGRDRELAELRAAYEATFAGQPVVLFVSGESGIGKSALVAHFLDELRGRGHAAVLAGRCYERESVPFKGIDSMVDDLSRYLRRLPREEAFALMPREVYALARVFPVLGRIEAVAQAPKKDIVDPQELRERAFTACGELLGRIRDRRPLVLFIDDAQWLDRDAVTLLGYLLGHHEPAAVLLVLSHRSERAQDRGPLRQVTEHARNNARLTCRELALSALSPEAARELAARLLGAAGERAAEIAHESNGSPFLLSELARQAQRAPGGARLTLHDALLAHTHSLAPEARRLLEVLAVAGRPLAVDLVLGAAGTSHEHADALHAERLVRGHGQGSERSLECYHDKIRETVAQALSPERARAVHASLLAVLVERAHVDAEHLALHAEGAGDREAAARYAVKAAVSASESMAFDRAASLYDRALELGDHGEDARRELGTKLGEALANAGRGADAARAYLVAASGAPEEHALELKRRAAEQLLISGLIDDGKDLLREVLRAVGLSLPSSPRTALLSLVWERARLKLRGLSFRERVGELPAERRRELDMLWTAVRGLRYAEPFTGVTLSSRYARLALDSGVPQHAARALATEATFAIMQGGSAVEAWCLELLDRAEGLAVASTRAEALAEVQLDRATVAFWRLSRDMKIHSERALGIFREHCAGVTVEISAALYYSQFSSECFGDLSPPNELSAPIDEAWRRGDLYSAVMLTGSSARARLIQGDAAGVRRHVAQALDRWPRPRDYSFPDGNLMLAELYHSLYSGDYERGLERIEADWSAIEKSQHLRNALVVGAYRGLRGGVALGVARLGRADAPALRALAGAEAIAIAHARGPFGVAQSEVLYAALALSEDDHGRALAHLRAALNECEALGMPAIVAAVRRRLGQVLGGDEGTALVAQGDAALRAMGAVDLEAATRVLAWLP